MNEGSRRTARPWKNKQGTWDPRYFHRRAAGASFTVSPDPSSNGHHYIDGARMTALAIQARETGEFSEELIATFYAMAEREWRKSPLRRLEALEDAQQEAVIECLEATSRFSGGAAFSFFRVVITSRFVELVRKAKCKKRCPAGEVFDVDDLDITEDHRIIYGNGRDRSSP